MIELYSWPTPNGFKVSIMLEETGLEYRATPVDITKGEQFSEKFLAISPNNKIPAILDYDGPQHKKFSVFESGAILMYLAEKTGEYMPVHRAKRYRVVEWLMFQMGGVGPMFGQANHFRKYAPEKIYYAIERYSNEAKRLYGVLDKRLGQWEYLAGGSYSIADMAVYPWIRSYEGFGDGLMEKFANIKRWCDAVEARPAVQKGMAVLAEHKTDPKQLDDNARSVLFGDQQYACR
ncbi:MAG: glutathione S-transferase N-terminal domain-containing protein [Rhodospirillales bacterium]